MAASDAGRPLTAARRHIGRTPYFSAVHSELKHSTDVPDRVTAYVGEVGGQPLAGLLAQQASPCGGRNQYIRRIAMFGCGEARGLYRFTDEVANAALTACQSDRLTHMDVLRQDTLDALLTARGFNRRRLLGGGLLGLLAAIGPHFSQPVHAEPMNTTPNNTLSAQPIGRTHIVPSSEDTVRLGQFDATLPNIVEIDSGDVVSFPNTWTAFLNRLQPGVSIDQIAQMRRDNPGRGPHSVIGPVGVRGSQPGDMIAVHYQRLKPLDWGANFSNPSDLGTGALPEEFPDGQVRYFNLDLQTMTTEFLPGIALPLAPFQGTLGVAPAQGGVVSSVPPGQHAGNLDLKELTEGSVLYIPVWQPTAKVYTGDSHAMQADGEVNLTAVETAMQEVRIQVILHPQAGWDWPFAETNNHWLAIGLNADLNEAFKTALRNTLDFLERKAGLTRLDAYSLASIGVDYRVTQVVDGNKGVHAMIPKSIFSDELRQTISIV
jgi:acetamidase/formamidase